MARPNHLTDLMTIPEGVDNSYAGIRNDLIQRYRNGEVSAEAALGGIASLYWAIQDTASDQTRFYLSDGKIDFAIEAGIESDVAHDIWTQAREDED